MIAILDNGTGVGVAKTGENSIILAFTDAKGKTANRFNCQ